jgi:prolyl-tRNA synthetase
MTRLSEYFLPTEKQAPADAEALSHKLMVRAGLIRQLGTGLWSFLPAGWRVHENIVQVIREEMNAIGAQEMLMPVLQPAELWQRSGRYPITALFKLQDRKGAELVLAMTHEEAVTSHVAQVVRSYRDLPFSLYHFQIKERDEPRPRAGLLRTREFIMKDAYTFDRDREGLDAHYERYRGAYDRVMDRCGLEWYRVESDVGMMGGFGAHEYMAPRGRTTSRSRPATPPTSRSRAPRPSRSSCRPGRTRPSWSTRPGSSRWRTSPAACTCRPARC